MILQRSQGTEFIKSKLVIFSVKATRLILSESVSSLSLFLQKMDVNRMRDDAKTEAMAAGESS